MNIFTRIVSAIALLMGSMAIPAIVPMAQAQISGTYTCVAKSPYATGVWQHYNLNFACRRALEECAYRTPMGYNCYITNRWYNY
jgi:hypothetical protein